MNLEKKLQKKFESITNLHDFSVRLERICHPKNYGDYFVQEKLIKIYTLDSEGNDYSEKVIEREALHELAHHLQFYHTSYVPSRRTVHGVTFREQFAKVLKKYYTKGVPRETLVHLIEEGYVSETEF